MDLTILTPGTSQGGGSGLSMIINCKLINVYVYILYQGHWCGRSGMTEAGMCGRGGGVSRVPPRGWRMDGLPKTLALLPSRPPLLKEQAPPQERADFIGGGKNTLGAPWLWLK